MHRDEATYRVVPLRRAQRLLQQPNKVVLKKGSVQTGRPSQLGILQHEVFKAVAASCHTDFNDVATRSDWYCGE